MTDQQILFISFTVKIAQTNFSKYQSCWDFFFEVFIWLLQNFDSMTAKLKSLNNSVNQELNLHIVSLQKLFTAVGIAEVKSFFNLTDKLATVQDVKNYVQALLLCERYDDLMEKAARRRG